MFVQTSGKSNQGSTYFTSDNPDFGATFTYYLKEAPKSKKDIRKEKEKKLFVYNFLHNRSFKELNNKNAANF